MPYTAEISRSNPACFLFLLDQSGSMSEDIGNSRKTKAEAVAEAINTLLLEIILRCVKGKEVLDYFHIGIITYGEEVNFAIKNISNKELIPISELAKNPLRIEITNQNQRKPIWFEPIASGNTPMCKALKKTYSILENWIKTFPNSFPPIVINITDGEATDGDPLEPAEKIKQLKNNDGNVLLFNIHLSSIDTNPIEFPDNENILPDRFSKLLFKMSSILPQYMRLEAKNAGYKVSDGTRGFVFNANMEALVKFLNIGTRTSYSITPYSEKKIKPY